MLARTCQNVNPDLGILCGCKPDAHSPFPGSVSSTQVFTQKLVSDLSPSINLLGLKSDFPQEVVIAPVPSKCTAWVIAQRNIENPDLVRFVVRDGDCGSWSCPVCRPILEKQWLNHLTALLPPTIRKITCHKNDYDSLTKLINRHHGDYAAIVKSPDTIVVFSTVPVAPREFSILQGELTKEAAQNEIKELITQTPYVRVTKRARPIRTSTEWTLTHSESERKESQWQTLKKIPATKSHLHDVLRKTTGTEIKKTSLDHDIVVVTLEPAVRPFDVLQSKLPEYRRKKTDNKIDELITKLENWY